MRGFAAAGGVYVISLVLNDTLRTIASEIALDPATQASIYQAVVWFLLAFVGSFIARRNFVAPITLGACVYVLISLSRYLEGYAIVGERPSNTELLIEALPTVFVIILSTFAGAIAGRRFGLHGLESFSEARYTNRKKILFIGMLALCVVAPMAYSAYWFAEAQDEVRKALDSIKVGVIPENVLPFDIGIDDTTEVVKQLMEGYSEQSEVKTKYKNGDGHHSYEVQILVEGGNSYTANAFRDYGEWHVICCYQY
jgi:hypothetical protein